MGQGESVAIGRRRQPYSNIADFRDKTGCEIRRFRPESPSHPSLTSDALDPAPRPMVVDPVGAALASASLTLELIEGIVECVHDPSPD